MRHLGKNDDLSDITTIYQSSISDSFGFIWYSNGTLVQWGRASITPSAANTVVNMTFSYPLSYDLAPSIQLSLHAAYPNIIEASVGQGTTLAAGLVSFVIYMTRTNTASTSFQWLATGYKAVS